MKPRTGAQRDVALPSLRLPCAYRILWLLHSGHNVRRAGPSRQYVPPCIARAVPLDAAAPASASSGLPVERDPPPLNAAIGRSTAANCSRDPKLLSITSPSNEGSISSSLGFPQYAAAGDSPASLETVSGPAAIPSVATQSDASSSASSVASGQAATGTPMLEASVTDAAAATAVPEPPAAAQVAALATPVNALTRDEAETSSSGSRTSWPGRRSQCHGDNGSGSRAGVSRAGRGERSAAAATRWNPPVYADALTSVYIWPRPKQIPLGRPAFLSGYPVPKGKTFNVNSFLGKKDPHGGQYLVPERRYRDFLASYAVALEEGHRMYLTENYHQSVYKYFLEFDWDWDADLALVMEVTPQLVTLATQIASEFYSLPYANVITSIRTPYKIHLNFPQLLTTELLAYLCRDRLLEACAERLEPRYAGCVDWERLIDFPHGSLRLMGSQKAPHMDSDPAWVRDKAYYPARLMADGRWQPGRITPALLTAASIFPQRQQVAAFERSPAYLDMIYSDLEACQKKMEERLQERARRRAEREQQQQQLDGASSGSGGQPVPHLSPGSRKNPLYVKLEVLPDEKVALKVHIKAKFRHKKQRTFNSTLEAAARGTPPPPPLLAPPPDGTATALRGPAAVVAATTATDGGTAAAADGCVTAPAATWTMDNAACANGLSLYQEGHAMAVSSQLCTGGGGGGGATVIPEATAIPAEGSPPPGGLAEAMDMPTAVES